MKKYTYSLPLLPPFSTYFGERRGVVIEWQDGRWSEASPLGGWSIDRIDEVIDALKKDELDSALPALQFALRPLPIAPISIPFCSLLAGTSNDILTKAALLKQEGVQHVKVKLAGFSLEKAIEIARKLAQDFLLRIDFNRELELRDALYFAEQLESESIDFFEEPLKDSRELCYFPFPIGLDESLRVGDYENLISLPQIKALVIKPTMSGGLKHWEDFGKPIVLSSSFESGVGIAQILLLAMQLKVPLLPLGIDTYRFLKEDLLENPLRFEGEFIHLPSTFAIKRHLLQPL